MNTRQMDLTKAIIMYLGCGNVPLPMKIVEIKERPDTCTVLVRCIDRLGNLEGISIDKRDLYMLMPDHLPPNWCLIGGL